MKKPTGTELIFREQAYKTAAAVEGIVLESNFNRTELKKISEDVFSPLESAYRDMFDRIYTYNNGVKNEEIPAAELSVIKSDLHQINESFHDIKFNGEDTISDNINRSKEDIFYVPTSYNTKDVILFTTNIDGKEIEGNLQKSWIRTDKGGIQVTWAIELETTKVTKAQFNEFAASVMKTLNVLDATDVGGGSPSPSDLTLQVINQVQE